MYANRSDIKEEYILDVYYHTELVFTETADKTTNKCKLGLHLSPAIWQSKINNILCLSLTVPNRPPNVDECKDFEICGHSSSSKGQIFFFQLGTVLYKSTNTTQFYLVFHMNEQE